MQVSGLTDDRRNFHCVTVASVDLIPPVLRDILTSHIQPVNLYKQIKLKKLNLRKEQQAICFIPPASGVPDYNKFDVTLLYTLIRNLCHLPCPAQGWGNPEGPEATDTQISDDIERLRLFRNKYYAHRISAKISDNEFKDIWGNLTSAISRIQSRYNVDYKDEVIRIEQSKYTLCHWQECVKILDALADKPDIIIKGENEIICGGTAKFEADVNNVESSCWSIRWQRCRGDDVKRIDTTMKKYSGSTKRKLVIYDVCKEDEGEYQALLSLESNGPEYKSRNTVRLYAVGEIPFLNISEVTSGSEGITIHFECGVLDQSPEVHLIEWRKNGQELDNKSNKYVEEGINSRHLTIPSPNYEDRGNYNCKVSNAVGSVSKNVMLDVPSVELLEVSPIVYGFKTTLKPVISSTPTPQKINWQTSKDGVDFHSIKKAKDSYHADSSLVIHKATFADKLYYRLIVWNGIGETISNTVYLNVTGSSPNIKTISKTNIKKRSVNLIGNVIIYDDSPGVNTFFWTRNNKTIDFEECDGKLVETRTDNPSLTITNVGPDDAGEYRLTAINDVGSCTSEAIVLGVPKVSEEKVEDEDKGGLWITVTIKSIPEPFHVQWSAKRNEDDTFAPIDINAKEYKGTTVTLPHPVLFVKQKDQLETICFRIEVSNFIGSTQQDISGDDTTKQRKIDSVESTIYNDDGRIFEFTMLSSALVKHFPPEKLDHLKFLIKNSNKVKNLTSVKEATSVLKCIDILQDENLFTPTDVIYMQFLCQEADCFDLYTKCVEYAECKQRALCYFKKPPVNGYTDVQFHVQGDVSGYTKDYINHVIKTVAVILRCKEEDVLLNGAQHSKSFLLSLSIKEPYVRKLLALEVKDRLKLRGLNIDYLIIDGNILDIEIPKAAYLGPRTTQSFKERSLSTGVQLRNQVDRNHAALYRKSSAHARCVYECTCAYDRWYPKTNITSSGGARPKKSSHRYPSSVDRSVLPDELQNNFYPDVLLIYSQKDEKLAQSFLTETRNKIKDHNYIVASYLDKQVWVNPADGLPDYKRCSAFMYLFTGKKSVKDYLEVTKHGHLGDLLYEEKFIPVLTEPEGVLDLPMSATVSCPLRYYKQQTSDSVPAIKEFLKKHANIRKEKEREHKKKEQAFLDSIETDTSVTPTNKQPIILRTKFAIIGDGGNIIMNKYTRDEKVPFMSQQYQNEFHGNPLKKGESLGSPEDVDELGPPSRDSRGSSQTPWHLPVSFKGKHNSYQSFQNRLSTQVEDFSRRREATLKDRPLSGSLNDVASIEMKQFSPTCNNRPVAREIPMEASFPVLPSISSMASQKPSNSDVYRSCGAPIECENRPSPVEVCCTMFSFSNIPDLYGPPSETNIPIPNPQKRHTHEECVENIASHDSLQSVLPGEGLSLGSLQDSD